MEVVQSITVKEILQDSVLKLKANDIEDPRLNAELLMCAALSCSRIDLYLDFDKPLTGEEVQYFESCIDRRLKREPLQYILGRTEFYGYEILLNKTVLIPRPETEILVEHILKDINACKPEKKSFYIFEIGTGSGCIVIALAKELDKSGTDYTIVSIDNSDDALATARMNCSKNNVNIEKVMLVRKDLFSIDNLKKDVDYIISNPPYISTAEYKLLQPEVKHYEPEHSLTDYGDGLSFYKKIFELAESKNFKGKIFCEIAYEQKEKIEGLADSVNFKNVEFYRDLDGIDRIIKAEK